jgi:hypothetical protein
MEPDAMGDESLSLLMGVSHYIQDITHEDPEFPNKPLQWPRHGLKRLWGIWGLAWKEVREVHEDAFILNAADLFPSWRRGEFVYIPENEFQGAVYLLFRERWRAKVCVQCGTYFVAKRPPQFYCSSKCFGEVRRNRNLLWWKRVGSGNRKARTTKAREKGDK